MLPKNLRRTLLTLVVMLFCTPARAFADIAPYPEPVETSPDSAFVVFAVVVVALVATIVILRRRK